MTDVLKSAVLFWGICHSHSIPHQVQVWGCFHHHWHHLDRQKWCLVRMTNLRYITQCLSISMWLTFLNIKVEYLIHFLCLKRKETITLWYCKWSLIRHVWTLCMLFWPCLREYFLNNLHIIYRHIVPTPLARINLDPLYILYYWNFFNVK